MSILSVRDFMARVAGLKPLKGAQSYGDYIGSKGPDVGEGLYALQKNQDQISEEDIQNDPLYQLDLQINNAKYGGGGGTGGTGLANKIAQAIASNAYSGPSVEDINRYGREGQSTIQNLYGQLGQYLQGAQQETANLYNQGTQSMTQAYDKAQADVAAGQQAAAANIKAQGELGVGGTGVNAATQSGDAAKAANARQASMLATNRANQLASQAAMGAGQQSRFTEFRAGTEREKGAQSGRFQNQVTGLLNKVMQEMAAASQRQGAAESQIRAEESDRASKAAAQNQAGQLGALKDAIKRAQSEQKGGDKLSGVQGVLSYAMRAGRPDMAKKFLDMLGASKQTAAKQNIQAKLGKAKGDTSIQATTPEEQLQIMMGSAFPSPVDFADKNLDPRGEDIMSLMNNPELGFLKKYLIKDPEQARRQNQYQSAFGKSKEEYEKGGRSSPLASIASHIWGGLTTGNPKNTVLQPQRSDFVKQMEKQFTPFVNLDLLRQNQGDISQLYNYFGKGRKDQDLLGALYDIYGGKYGQG